MSEATLNEARRIAEQSVGDRLDGKQADEAKSVILRLMEEAGLDYRDGLRLMGAIEWSHWNQGWATGRKAGQSA